MKEEIINVDETFSSIDFVVQCLVDSERTKIFEKAIKKVVTPESVVLESGTGSGIMAMFAARAGAKKVVAIEIDPYVANIAKSNVKRNGLDSAVTIVNSDMREYQFNNNEKFDIVIMEMLTTGMIDEQQVQAVNYLHEKGVIDVNTKMVPSRQDTTIRLTNTNFYMYGFDMCVPIHTWKYIQHDNPTVKYFSNREILNSVSFNVINPEKFSRIISFTVIESGIINSVFLESVSFFDGDFEIRDTLSLNGPVVIPLLEDIEVRQDDVLTVEISYFFAKGYGNFKVNFLN